MNYTRAKEIQEVRLLEGGLRGKLDASLTKFLLINHHGYVSEYRKVPPISRRLRPEAEPTETEWKEFWERELCCSQDDGRSLPFPTI